MTLTPEEIWEEHDWEFHKKSRAVGFNNPAVYKYPDMGFERGKREKPRCKDLIDLPIPDMGTLRDHSPNFFSVLNARRSIREYYHLAPINIFDLGALLYVSCHKQGAAVNGRGDTISFRPYPSAGGIHELKVYVAVRECRGLSCGLYEYDHVAHALKLISQKSELVDAHLDHAEEAASLEPGAQVLLLVTTDLPKLAWKYEGIAYSLTLKNLGCLFQTWYLVATAMNLAPCAIGCGDSENFAKTTGIPEHEEALIGEFALGSRP